MMWEPYRNVAKTTVCPKCGGLFHPNPRYNAESGSIHNGMTSSVKDDEHLVWFCDTCEYQVRTQCLDAGGAT